MSMNTTNYNLVKPRDNEAADINVINGNMDVIDTNLKTLTVQGKMLTDSIAEVNTNLSKEVTPSLKGLMSASDKVKLDGIEDKANNYIHPTTSGNKHIPSGGTVGQILQNTANGTATWQDLVGEEVGISETVRTLLGLSTDNANVDVALQKIPISTSHIVKITSSRTWTVPSGILDNRVDVFIVGGGVNGSSGTNAANLVTQSGGNGGNGGNVLYVPGFQVVPSSNVSVIIGASNGGVSSFGVLASSLSSLIFTSTNGVDITALPITGGGNGFICPIDGNTYGIAGASGGWAKFPSTAGASANNGNAVTLTSKTGGAKLQVITNAMMGGGGASANANGGEAYQSGSSYYAGAGANAIENTGNGGGGGGSIANGDATTYLRYAGAGGNGGSGVVILRYFAKGVS